MANTYTWKVSELNVTPTLGELTNVVESIRWFVVGSDGENTFSVTDVTAIPFDENTEYTPYENLTEEQVISWVHSILGADGVSKYQTDIDDVLSQLAVQTSTTPELPWGKTIMETTDI